MTIARRHAVSGWVRNLTDGRVEAIIEGREQTLADFVSDVVNSTYGHVQDVQQSITAATGLP